MGTTELQFINHEEGRIRVITPYVNVADPANVLDGNVDLLNGKRGSFDYFITDHLGNTRAIITEEVNKAASKCTMETANSTVQQYEESLFGNPTNNEVASTRVLTSTTGWTANTSQYVSKLQSLNGTAKIGPNVLLKVMAGDKLNIMVDYWYFQDPGYTSSNDGLNAMAQSLLSALTGNKATAVAKEQANAISTSESNDFALQGLFTSQSGTGNVSSPKAFINYIFFDENFKYIGTNSSYVRVYGANQNRSVTIGNIITPQNGYVYAYLSNESAEPVYFDNFQVSHQRSPLIEENHYYAFGQKMTGICSKALSTSLNPNAISYGYQGEFAEEVNDFDLNYNEFELRNFDPQIGRWTGVDPYDEFPSPYTGMGNDPVNNVDEDGGFTGGAGIGAISGFIIGTAIAKLSGSDWDEALLYGAGGALLGGGIGYGIGQSQIDHTGFGKNFRAFYEGFFDPNGYVYDAKGNYAANPNIWGGIGSLFKNVSLEEISTIGSSFISATVTQISGGITPPSIKLQLIHPSPSPVHINPCRLVPIYGERRILFNFPAASPDGGSYAEPALSVEQMAAMSSLGNGLASMLGSNDRIISANLVHTMRSGNAVSGPSTIPINGGAYWQFDRLSGRRIDSESLLENPNLPFRLLGGVGNTIIQNYRSQTNRMANALGSRFGVNVSRSTRWGVPNPRYRFSGVIGHRIRVGFRWVCN